MGKVFYLALETDYVAYFGDRGNYVPKLSEGDRDQT
jgi:hypothetical protein